MIEVCYAHGMDEEAPGAPIKSDFVTALARGLRVIEVFAADAPELTLSEVAQRSELSPATARRALFTLMQLGYVAMNGKRFLLLPKVLGLGAAFLSSMNIRDIAQPPLQEIADRFKDSASMAILDGEQVMYIAHVPNKRRIRYTGSVGYRSPAYGTSLGLVLWAGLDDAALDERLAKAPYPAYTSQTRISAEQLRAAVLEARQLGYATAQEQLEYGIVAIAVPVRTQGRVIAAINCSSELARNDLGTLVATRLGPLRETAAQIEHAIERFPALAHAIGAVPV
jgi:IclR family transcriptional regulator, pca regulon regulatory protein